jgi:hypothetical protein
MTKKIFILIIWICVNASDSFAQVQPISKNDIIGKWTTHQTLNGSKVLLILKKNGRHKLVFSNTENKRIKYYGSWTLSDSIPQPVFDSLTSSQIKAYKASPELTNIYLETCDDCEGMILDGTIHEITDDHIKLAIPFISNTILTFYHRHSILF